MQRTATNEELNQTKKERSKNREQEAVKAKARAATRFGD
jgi:hypothetical protein